MTMKFSFYNFLTSIFLVIFSMVLVREIQDGDTVGIIIAALFIVIDTLTLSFTNKN